MTDDTRLPDDLRSELVERAAKAIGGWTDRLWAQYGAGRSGATAVSVMQAGRALDALLADPRWEVAR